MIDISSIRETLLAERDRINETCGGDLDALYVPPGQTHEYDWRGEELDYDQTGEGWTYWEAFRQDGKGPVYVAHNGTTVWLSDEDDDAPDATAGYAEGPTMNYWYELGDISDANELARKLVDLPLCVVEVKGTWGLALTGGGMDLSWEIAEAFTLAGYLPPADHLRLPRMAGRGESERDKHIIAAVRYAAIVETLYAFNDLDDAQRFEPA